MLYSPLFLMKKIDTKADESKAITSAIYSEVVRQLQYAIYREGEDDKANVTKCY